MNTTEKRINALIDALGVDLEENDILLGVKFIEGKSPVVNDKNVNHVWELDTNTCHAFEDNLNENINKPPFGLTPKSIHDGIREEEIISAMIRYLKDRKPIPEAWFTELYTLQAKRDAEVTAKMSEQVPSNKPIDPLDVLYDGVALRHLVENINQLSELDEKYRWIKYPKCSYDAVYDSFSEKMIIWATKHYFEVLGVKVVLDE
tara:strand:- start:359 stop:970 length:612 start_codon:yes stop_codon:yes gene_type:complete